MSHAPYGALVGFVLAADVREVAAYYGVRAKSLRARSGSQSQTLVHARAALCWKLCRTRGLSPARVGQLLGLSAEAVRQACATHQKRIADFCSTAQGLAAPRPPLTAAEEPADG